MSNTLHKQQITTLVFFILILSAVTLCDQLNTAKQPDSQVKRELSPTAKNSSFNMAQLAKQLHKLGSQTEERSALKQQVSSWAQTQLTNRLGLGNERIAVYQNQLVFRDDLRWVTGPGFLINPKDSSSNVLLGNASGRSSNSNPIPAIQQLAESSGGIPLIMAPIPNKAMFQHGNSKMINNVDFQNFRSLLQASGILVFWPFDEPSLINQWSYLKTDTHWSPQTMALYAERLVQFMAQHKVLRPGSAFIFRQDSPSTVEHSGDLAKMLALNPESGRFAKEKTTIVPIKKHDGSPWQSVKQAPLLILGDSYTNIFTDANMGWGSNAGLGPTLSYLTQTEVDVIAFNGAGPTQTRAQLARREKPFSGAKVVIWLVAIRELAQGSWPLITIAPASQINESVPITAPTSFQALHIRAKLKTHVSSLNPNGTPYANAVINLKFDVLEVLEGEYQEPEILCKFPLLLNRQLQPVAQIVSGQHVTLKLEKTIPSHVAHWTLLDDTQAYHLDEWWVVSFE